MLKALENVTFAQLCICRFTLLGFRKQVNYNKKLNSFLFSIKFNEDVLLKRVLYGQREQ